MSTIVLEAPKLYLDTSHLIRIANLRLDEGKVREDVRSAYKQLDECIRRRHFGVLFNPSAALDWIDGKATLESSLEIAAVLDSAALQYETEGDTFIYLYEILKQLKRQNPDLQLPEFEILFVRDRKKSAKRALMELKERVPEFFDPGDLTEEASAALASEMPFASVSDEVRAAWGFKEKRSATYEGRVSGYKHAYAKELASFQANKNGKPDVVGWLKGFLKVDRIISKLNVGADTDSLLREIDLTKCPAVNLYLRASNQRARAGNVAKDNDVDDWMSVALVPYADLFLTERNLAHFILQADPKLQSKVTHDPKVAIDILKPWMT